MPPNSRHQTAPPASEYCSGVLLRRYQRFLADIRLDSGEVITAHTPNTGAMSGCAEPGSRVSLRAGDNPKRKYRWSWIATEVVGVAGEKIWVGVEPGAANQIVAQGIRNGVIRELQGYRTIRSEVPYGEERSRIDLLLQAEQMPDCYVEVKSVTLAEATGVALFPDAVTSRGSKHLRELMVMADTGKRAVIFFCVQRPDVKGFAPAAAIDPSYAQLLQQAVTSGVEAFAYRCQVSAERVVILDALPLWVNAD
ncbi:MAG: DNA/RNA nuclease SfsA [Gammaproteobacteria bacterium]|nr:DNA/RNA nuclease SfsA [Gammaproteobacteria bacterium]